LRGGKLRGSGFFFRPGARFRVRVRVDGGGQVFGAVEGEHVGDGELTLGDGVFVDSEAMDYDPFKKVEKMYEWRHEFDQFGKGLDDGPANTGGAERHAAGKY
jgi:hypothetical protein